MSLDAETKLALNNMKDEIIAALNKSFAAQMQTLESHLTQLNDLKIKSLEKEIDQHKSWHGSHFEKIDKIESSITKSRESILKDVDEKLEKAKKNSNSNVSSIIAFIAIFITIIGFIMSIIPKG